MQFIELAQTASFALFEGSIYERLRRHPAVEFDPQISHAGLIYHPEFSRLLEEVHREYLEVAQRQRLPICILTDTWRASQERILKSGFCDRPVNQDNVHFLVRLRESYDLTATPIFIGGMSGPRGDAYRPEAALTSLEAEQFHAPQLEALASAGVDFLLAATLPAFSEAQGIALAQARLGLPYLLSFVIRADGALLDGTPLAEVIDRLDQTLPQPPTGYAINCVHPTVFSAGMSVLERQQPGLSRRILAFQANTSAKDPADLDGSAELETEQPEVLAGLIAAARQRFQTPWVGGCCGTDASHIQCLAETYRNEVQ